MDGLFADDTYEQLQKLEDAYILINKQYVEEVNPAELTESAIRTMLKGLDLQLTASITKSQHMHPNHNHKTHEPCSGPHYSGAWSPHKQNYWMLVASSALHLFAKTPRPPQ